VQVLAHCIGVHEAVAGQDLSEMDRGRPRSDADRFGQPLERESMHRFAQAQD
jgi:hypothetical protein